MYSFISGASAAFPAIRHQVGIALFWWKDWYNANCSDSSTVSQLRDDTIIASKLPFLLLFNNPIKRIALPKENSSGVIFYVTEINFSKLWTLVFIKLRKACKIIEILERKVSRKCDACKQNRENTVSAHCTHERTMITSSGDTPWIDWRTYVLFFLITFVAFLSCVTMCGKTKK